MLLGHDGFLYLLAGGSSLCVVTVWILTVTATLPVLLLASTSCTYYSTGCATESCPCRVQPPHACRTAFPFVCTYSSLCCIAVWARRCHSGFMQH